MGELYERIAALCNDKGVSIYRLCKEAGVQPSVLTELKMGRTKGLAAKNLQRIAAYFSITVDELLGEQQKPATDNGDGLNEKQEEIRRLLSLLSDQEAELVLRQIKGLVQDR